MPNFNISEDFTGIRQQIKDNSEFLFPDEQVSMLLVNRRDFYQAVVLRFTHGAKWMLMESEFENSPYATYRALLQMLSHELVERLALEKWGHVDAQHWGSGEWVERKLS